MATGASRPWNLSTVPTFGRAASRPSTDLGDLRDLRVVGGDDQDVVDASVRAPPSRSRHGRSTSASIASAIQRASSRDRLPAPRARCGTWRIPVPPTGVAGDRAAGARCRRPFQAPLVERVGDERVDVGVEPVRRAQQQAAIGGDRPFVAHQVLERRGGGTLGVGALRDLRQLVGIAQQHHGTRPRRPRRIRVASENCPASSTNRTSTAPSMSSRAHSQAVPPTTSPCSRPGRRARPRCRRWSRSAGVGAVVVALARDPDGRGRSSARWHRATASRRLAITRWDWAVTPTRFPSATRSRIMRAAV